MHSAHSRFCVAVLRRAPAQKCTRRKDGFQSAPNQIVDQRGINDRTEDILSVRYDVVNGQVVYKPEVKAPADRKALDCYSDVDVEALKDSVLWHEVCGQLKWLILSRHLPQESVRSYLEEEKQRLKQGFAKVDTKMKEIGGIRECNEFGGAYKAQAGLPEEVGKAVAKLQSKDALLRNYNIGFNELYSFETHIATLDKLLSGVQTS